MLQHDTARTMRPMVLAVFHGGIDRDQLRRSTINFKGQNKNG
jgi:hypothetical protein